MSFHSVDFAYSVISRATAVEAMDLACALSSVRGFPLVPCTVEHPLSPTCLYSKCPHEACDAFVSVARLRPNEHIVDIALLIHNHPPTRVDITMYEELADVRRLICDVFEGPNDGHCGFSALAFATTGSEEPSAGTLLKENSGFSTTQKGRRYNLRIP